MLRVVDLSHPIDPGIQVYPGDPSPVFAPHATIDADGFALLHLSLGSQTGTHIDAPSHIVPGGATVDELDPGVLVGPGVILDVSDRVESGTVIGPELFDGDRPVAGDIVLIHTGWSERFGTDTYFDNPSLSLEACRWLLDCGVRTVGIDAPSVDATGDHGLPAHHVLCGAGVVICENLRNLEAVDFPNPLISLLPIPLVGADGAPVRAVAMDPVRGATGW